MVVPFTPKPCPDCVNAAEPEKLPWPWADVVVTVQVPAKSRAEALELLEPLLQAVRKISNTLRLRAKIRFM